MNKKIGYRCDHIESEPLTVETGISSTDDDAASVVVLDTDGEWIEMKSRNTVKKQMLRRQIMPIMAGFLRDSRTFVR